MRHNLIVYISVACALIISISSVNSQEYRFNRITVSDGLLNNNVTEIYEDKSGHFWIGTGGGLQLYNGADFISFVHNPSDPLSLPYGTVLSITQDTEGDVWVGTQNGGLARFKEGIFESFRHVPGQPNGLSHNVISTLLADHQEGIWIGTSGGGLDRYINGRLVHYESVQKNRVYNGNIRSLAQSPDGTVWIGCWSGGLHSLHNGKIEPVDILNNDARFKNKNVSSLLVDHEGRLWIGAWGDGLFLLQGNELEFFQEFSGGRLNNQISSLSEDHEGGIWVGTYGGGMARMHGKESIITTNLYGDNLSLASNVIEDTFMDQHGTLWVGHQNTGISKLINTGFRSIKYNPENGKGLPEENVNAISGNRGGDIWFGTSNGVSTKWRAGQFSYIDIKSKANTDTSEKNRFLYFGDNLVITGQSIWRYILTHENWQELFDNLLGQFGLIFQVHEDQSKNTWLCTSKKGLVKLQNDGNIRYFNDSAISNIHGMIFDHQGRIWIASHDAGVSVIAHDTLVASYSLSDSSGLDNMRVRSLFCDSNENIWASTWGGALNKLEEQSQTFTKYYNPSDNSDIVSITEDQEGFLWLGTAHGINRFNPANGEFINFGIDQGVDAYPFMPNSVYLDTISNNIFFGGENGVTLFDPSRLNLEERLPQVMMTSVHVLNEKIDSLSYWFRGFHESKVELDYTQNSFSIEYAALNMDAEYAYYLEGFETDWNYVYGRRFASYVNVPPGKYTFRLKASNPIGTWSEDVNLLTIQIIPPFWQTWWFKGLVIVALALMVFGLYESRLRNIKRINEFQQVEIEERIKIQHELETKNAELERFNYTVSHDLKSPLITIKGYLGLIEEDLDIGDVKSAKRSMATVKGAADKMRELLEDLLSYSRIGATKHKLGPVDINQLVKESIQTHEKALADDDFKIEVIGQLPIINGEKARLNEVIDNLIHNAIKFSRGEEQPEIEIGVQDQNDSSATLYVKDNGVGIPEEYRTKVFEIFERIHGEIEGTGIGLAIVKRVVELHGGRIWIVPNTDQKGTKFLFKLPKNITKLF